MGIHRAIIYPSRVFRKGYLSTYVFENLTGYSSDHICKPDLQIRIKGR